MAYKEASFTMGIVISPMCERCYFFHESYMANGGNGHCKPKVCSTDNANSILATDIGESLSTNF